MNKERITIKKHITFFITYEILFLWGYFIVYLLVNFILNYNELEDHSPVNYIFYMDVITWIIFILSGLLLTGVIFFRWYIDVITIDEKYLSFRKGILGKKCTIFYKDIEDIYEETTFLGNYFNCGCINIKLFKKDDIIRICFIPNIKKNFTLISKRINFYKNLMSKKEQFPDLNIDKLLKEGENEYVEFKQSLRWDYKLNKVNKLLEDVILKSISGFLNANGGFLFIGVNDKGEAIGLENDYRTLKKFGKDYFEIHLINLITSSMGKNVMEHIEINFYSINNKEIAVITILPSPEPIFVSINNKWHFYVRLGNSTHPLDVKEAVAYIKSHFV